MLGEPDDDTVAEGIRAIEIIRIHVLLASATKAVPVRSKKTSRGREKVLFQANVLMTGLVEPLPARVLVNPDGVTARIILFPVSATAIKPSTGEIEMPCGAENSA